MAQFTNQATLNYNGTSVNSNIVTGEITRAIRAFKNATVGSYRAGETVTYVISIRNDGTTDYNGLTISDNLGEYTLTTTGTAVPLAYTGDDVLYFVDGILQASPTALAGPPLTISGINVPAGSDAVIIYRAALNNTAPLGADGSITNIAAITGGGLSEALTVSDTIEADTSPLLSITKELSPTNVVENGTITYTFTIRNTGADEAEVGDNISITDTFTPALEEPLTVTLNGAPFTAYTYENGVFTTTPGAITVPGAEYVSDPLTGAVTINPGSVILTVSGTI